MQKLSLIVALSFLSAFGSALLAQGKVSSPTEVFGHSVGEDHFLANYSQLVSYWRKLAKESPRMIVEEIGKTSYGQKMLMAVISSPKNMSRLDRYRQSSKRLALARNLSETDARRIASAAKSVVWIDAGMHATESIAAQNILELVYRMTSRNDAETLRILDNVILLVCPANPDGMEMVANAYMANKKVGRLPVLYQRYVGHDNNRDFYMSNMRETEAINRVLYRRWLPQIVYNHHQSAPRGTIIFTPPFRDPFNYNVDPLVIRGIELVAAHINHRFASEGKRGVISRTGAPYSTWWNGGLRTTTYFHNMIGILTEVFGKPEPTKLVQSYSRRLPYGDYPMPIASTLWHARQTIEYLQTSNMAILDLAARYREDLLYNSYVMGRNAIKMGNRDNWTPTPRLLAIAKKRRPEPSRRRGRRRAAGGASTAEDQRAEEREDGNVEKIEKVQEVDAFADPDLRDARGYILPKGQADFSAATRFVNILRKSGVEVMQATTDFNVNGTRYGRGSYVVKAAQAFRAQVMDMFEPQWHPDDLGSGGEPVRPYDSAGWTPAMQMGVTFDKILDGFDGPFRAIEGLAKDLPGSVTDGKAGFVMSHAESNSYRASNRLLTAGETVYWTTIDWKLGKKTLPAGSIFISKKKGTFKRIKALAADLGLDFLGVASVPPGEVLQLKLPRIGLFDVYGGHMPTGWAQWVLEQFEFPVDLVFGKRIHDGKLIDDYDALIFLTGLPRAGNARAGNARTGAASRRRRRRSRVDEEEALRIAKAMPPFRDWSRVSERLVRLEKDKAIPALEAFVEAGGTLLAMGSQATLVSKHFKLPIVEGVFVKDKKGKLRRSASSEFFIPGSLVNITVDRNTLLGYGLPSKMSTMFRRSPVFALDKEKNTSGIAVVSSYTKKDTLASGWAIGQEFLHGKDVVLSIPRGKGSILLYGADVLYRGQPLASFKFVFNGILGAAARRVRQL